MERYQVSSETGKTFDEITDDELALVNQAIRAALPSAGGIRYDFKEKTLLMDWMRSGQEPKSSSFKNLSDGQKGVVALIVDIARRMCILNPQLGNNVIRETPGVILIDELDLHLHPSWQRSLTTGLKAAFPKIQFITSSHSPQVIGELSPEEIILLRPLGTAHPQVSYGLDSSRVLEEIMETPPRSLVVQEQLERLFRQLENNDLPGARDTLSGLQHNAAGIAELARAEALLKRKEVLGH